MGRTRCLHGLARSWTSSRDTGPPCPSVPSKPLSVLLPPPSDFLWQYVHSTPLAGPLGEIGDGARAALEQDVTSAWRTFLDGDALQFDGNAVLTTARK